MTRKIKISSANRLIFANVFLKAQTKGNVERMRKIMDYTQRFENQEFAERE